MSFIRTYNGGARIGQNGSFRKKEKHKKKASKGHGVQIIDCTKKLPFADRHSVINEKKLPSVVLMQYEGYMLLFFSLLS